MRETRKPGDIKLVVTEVEFGKSLSTQEAPLELTHLTLATDVSADKSNK